MRVATKALEREPTGAERPFTFRREELEGVGRRVAVDGSLVKLSPGLLVRLRLAWEAEGPCDRCLTPVPLELSADAEETVGTQDAPDEATLHLGPEGLDVEPLVREAAVLGWPVKVLCRPDCKGLCPSCGKDLNAGDCGCRETPWNPAFEALGHLKGEDD